MWCNFVQEKIMKHKNHTGLASCHIGLLAEYATTELRETYDVNSINARELGVLFTWYPLKLSKKLKAMSPGVNLTHCLTKLDLHRDSKLNNILSEVYVMMNESREKSFGVWIIAYLPVKIYLAAFLFWIDFT